MNVPFSYASPTLSVEALKHSIAYKLMFIIGKDPAIANKHEWLNATLFAVRDRMVEALAASNRAQLKKYAVYYLSMEFLDWPYAFERLVVVGHLRRCEQRAGRDGAEP